MMKKSGTASKKKPSITGKMLMPKRSTDKPGKKVLLPKRSTDKPGVKVNMGKPQVKILTGTGSTTKNERFPDLKKPGGINGPSVKKPRMPKMSKPVAKKKMM